MLTYKNIFFLFSGFVLLVVLMLMAFWIGHYQISLLEYKNILLNIFNFDLSSSEVKQAKEAYIILAEIRLPRIIAAILIGASLSVSGAVFQGMFVNPLVSPGILGVLSGAGFGASLGMLFGLSLFMIQGIAFIFGFIAVFLALAISRFYGQGNSILMLVLGGVISSSLFGALLSLVKYVADPYNTLPSIVYWLMGSLSATSLNSVLIALPIMLICIGILIFFSKYLDVLSLGKDEAETLGVNVFKMRIFIIVIATILSALSVMLAGVIGWVGLVIPHISRFLVGANHTILLPFCAILGGTFLLIVDTISRGVLNAEIPLGILTSLVGIPVFIIVLKFTFSRRTC